MTLKELESMREETLKILDHLDNGIKHARYEPKGFEWPAVGDIYYYIASDGAVIAGEYADNDYGFVKALLSFGNIFRTEEEAMARFSVLMWMSQCPDAWGHIEVMKELLDLADADSSHAKYSIWLSRKYSRRRPNIVTEVDVVADNIFYENNMPSNSKLYPCYLTKESAERAISLVGKERIMRYYFLYD